MATTFTGNYQIKLIGTGLEAGTWGTSTNENLKRIEQALGGSSTVDVDLPGGTSTYTTGVLEWCTADTVAAGVAGSEGRDCFVEFTSATQATKVKVRGPAGGDYTERVFFVYNSSGHTLTFNSHSGTTDEYDVLDGSYAVICTQGSAGVQNLLSKLQIDNLVFPVAADILVPASTAAALEIASGSTKYLTVNTSATSVVVGQKLDIDNASIDVETQATAISVSDDTDAALDITEGSNSYIEIDTQNSSPRVIIGGEPSDCETLQIDTETVDLTNQATAMSLKTSSATALEMKDGGTSLLSVDTSNDKVVMPTVDINGGAIDGTTIGGASPGEGTFTDAALIGTGVGNKDGVLAFDVLESTSSDSYGIRNNNGKIEAKNSDSDWESFRIAKDALAAATVAGTHKMGKFDIGPFRIIFNTISTTASGVEITLGTGSGKTSGTPYSMSSEIYFVLGVQATNADFDSNFFAYRMSDTNIFVGADDADVDMTYVVVGDSGL